MTNISQVFPDYTELQKQELFRRSNRALARLFSDCIRLVRINRNWLEQHVELPFKDRYSQIRGAHPERGILFISGHLGSFDLFAHCTGLLGQETDFITRSFKNRHFDRWFLSVRERTGHRVIHRQGALRKVISSLKSGRDVGILFDQNVTRKHALFIPWFGRLAATTGAPALAALATACPVAVMHMAYLGGEKYEIRAQECDVFPIYNDTSLSKDEKLMRLTELFVQGFEKMILNYPEGWFWLHRRWKTRPEGEVENFYYKKAVTIEEDK